MSEFRRRLMMAAFAGGGGGGVVCPYEQTGLVFWLDGIEKGGNSGSWTDLIGGLVLTNHGCTFNADNVELDGTNYLDNNTAGLIVDTQSGYTIECCIQRDSSASYTLFVQNYQHSAAIQIISNLALISTSERAAFLSLSFQTGYNYALSFNQTRGLMNGVAKTPTANVGYANYSQANISIGCRNQGEGHFIGKIYSIRIYNRELTQAEMLSNQQVDNQRFNLGLNI